MTVFKKGDRFIPRKPKENNTGLIWRESMDKYDGVELTVVEFTPVSGYIRSNEGYIFHPDWCEKVEENHIPEVRKMVDSSETPNGQEHIVEANKMIDWEQRRYELAKEFMTAITSGFVSAQVGWSFEDAIKDSITFADEMIKQLKGQ